MIQCTTTRTWVNFRRYQYKWNASNQTKLSESPLDTIRNLTSRIDLGNPFDKIDELRNYLKIFKDKSSDSDYDYSDYSDDDDDSDNYIDDNLNINRNPVYVYKYPVDGTYGSMFQGFETIKDEVLDLSRASDKELKEFYSLPRSFSK